MSATSRRGELLEFAVLGQLHDSPLHGYALRKRLNAALGAFRALSYGTLYPCLRGLLTRGLITESAATTPAAAGKRARIVYELTPEGKEHFQDLVGTSDPHAWEDDGFDVRLAFFARTETAVRLRILEGRRSRVEERLASIREASARHRERWDAWTTALQRHGEESTEREVRWLTELIESERSQPTRTTGRTREPAPTAGDKPTEGNSPAYNTPDPTTKEQ